MEILSHFPLIEDNTRYYLIKTNNGKYYQSYFENGWVGLYALEVRLENAMAVIINKPNKQKELQAFSEIKPGDIVLIPDFRHKHVAIGIVVSDFYIRDNKIYRQVKWVNVCDMENLQTLQRFFIKQRKKRN